MRRTNTWMRWHQHGEKIRGDPCSTSTSNVTFYRTSVEFSAIVLSLTFVLFLVLGSTVEHNSHMNVQKQLVNLKPWWKIWGEKTAVFQFLCWEMGNSLRLNKWVSLCHYSNSIPSPTANHKKQTNKVGCFFPSLGQFMFLSSVQIMWFQTLGGLLRCFPAKSNLAFLF